MEARNITIVSSRTQQKTVVSSTAETLGELKADLSRAGIDYNGLAFFEGISKTELKDDAAILPKDLPWKGQRTNNLVFMLTEPQKKIKNGVAVMDRATAYAFIKENGLAADVEKTFGNNYTRCKTADLIDYCTKKSAKAAKAAPKAAPKAALAKATSVKKAPVKPTSEKVSEAAPACECKHDCDCNSDKSLAEKIASLLMAKNILTPEEIRTGVVAKSDNVDFSQAEINEMFRNIR